MGFVRKLRSFFRPAKVNADIEEELRFHIDMREKANVGAGMSPADAQFNARRRFGT
jgi:hypothetical protein